MNADFFYDWNLRVLHMRQLILEFVLKGHFYSLKRLVWYFRICFRVPSAPALAFGRCKQAASLLGAAAEPAHLAVAHGQGDQSREEPLARSFGCFPLSAAGTSPRRRGRGWGTSGTASGCLGPSRPSNATRCSAH